MNVITAEIKKHGADKGLFIKTSSRDNLICGDFLVIKANEKFYPFKIVSLFTFGEELEITAKEVGYFARQLGEKKDLNLRSLINLEISVVTDEQRIKEIREESSWC